MSKFATREQNLEASVLSSWVKEYKPRKMPSKVRRKKKEKKGNQWSRNLQFIPTISDQTLLSVL